MTPSPKGGPTSPRFGTAGIGSPGPHQNVVTMAKALDPLGPAAVITTLFDTKVSARRAPAVVTVTADGTEDVHTAALGSMRVESALSASHEPSWDDPRDAAQEIPTAEAGGEGGAGAAARRAEEGVMLVAGAASHRPGDGEQRYQARYEGPPGGPFSRAGRGRGRRRRGRSSVCYLLVAVNGLLTKPGLGQVALALVGDPFDPVEDTIYFGLAEFVKGRVDLKTLAPQRGFGSLRSTTRVLQS